jgi:serine protease
MSSLFKNNLMNFKTSTVLFYKRRRMKFINVTLLILLIYSHISISQIFKGTENEKYSSNVIILKIRPEYKSICYNDKIADNHLISIFQSIDVQSSKKVFPYCASPVSKYNKRGDRLTDLSQIYEIKYKSNASIFKIIKQIKNNPAVEYAQPHYLPELCYTPNDPLLSFQYYLNNIQATQAWDICKGDSSIIIGITDTGTQIDHEDLVDNIAYNYNDPIDGIDNDGDGYTDNFRGWDLGDNDNNPQWNENNYSGSNPHGIYVSGFASARADNNKGIAGVGFRTKFLSVKISDSTGALTMAYEGIVYAADHGCSIINCSWGGKVSDDFGRDVINYATFNKNALIVSASGNDALKGNPVLFPCAFDNVLCVGGTNNYDLLWNHTCYGTQVDLCAPGENVFTTFENNSYNNGWGTSFASPIVAGCAAIVKVLYHDTLTPMQIGEILKVTADNIDTIGGNSAFAHLMGSGRVNLYRALTDTLRPSIVFNYLPFNDLNGRSLKPNDTTYIKGKYTNYLAPVTNLKVTLTSLSPYINILDSINNIGVLSTLDTFLNYNNPFMMMVLPNIPSEEKIILKLTYSGTNYSSEQFISFIANETFINIDTNNISTTITSNGRIGFNNFLMLNGIGFNYKDSETYLSESGFLIGNSITRVSDCLYGNYDFKMLNAPYINNINKADLFIQSKFNDDSSGNRLNIDVSQNVYAWNDSVDADFIILEYYLKNLNNYAVNNLYAGIFADWDIINPSLNKAAFDSADRFSYVYHTGNKNMYTAIKILSNTPFNHYAIDNIQGGNGGIDITDGFTKQEEYYSLSTTKNNAGSGNSGNDVAVVLSSGPLSLNVNDSLKVAFALMASENLFSLHNIAQQAQNKYDSLNHDNGINKTGSNNSFFIVYPNPVVNNDNFYVLINLDRDRFINIDILDYTGKELKKIKNGKLPAGIYSLKVKTDLQKGIYLVRYSYGNDVFIRKISIQ